MLMQLEAKVVFGIHPMACTPGQMRCLGHTADASDSGMETSKEATSSDCASVSHAAKHILASVTSKCVTSESPVGDISVVALRRTYTTRQQIELAWACRNMYAGVSAKCCTWCRQCTHA